MLGSEQTRRSVSQSSARKVSRLDTHESAGIVNRVRSQLEYYWSDANVSRDKFFSERLARDADCWVTVGELRSFPILRRLRASESEIVAAAKSSPFLVVDEFFRIDRNWREFPPRLAIDNLANLQTDVERTVYIENTPLSVDREELVRLLGQGDVQHISLPRHPLTGERQGFCFAEFGTADQARECVRRLQRTWPEHWPQRKDGRRMRLMSYKRWAVLRDESKSCRSRSGVYGYCPEVARMLGDSGSEGEDSDSVSSTGSAEDESELEGSFAETSLAERRRKNAGSIRPNSLARLTCIPVVTGIELRVWLGHFAVSLQYLDYLEGAESATLRFSNRNARDFFLTDYSNSKLPLKGSLPVAVPLTPL